MTPPRPRPLLAVLVGLVAAPLALAQGIPAVSGVLETQVRAKVPKGLPPTLTLRTPDRPAAFYARCVFGSPQQEVVAESKALAAGDAFVIALPADTTARTAECAVVARFANGLSERKPVTMAWTIVEPEPEPDPEAETPEGEPSPDAAPSSSATDRPPRTGAPAPETGPPPK